eukprot:scaffold54205_cov19-Tisochrysis_lutea.AAC.4
MSVEQRRMPGGHVRCSRACQLSEGMSGKQGSRVFFGRAARLLCYWQCSWPVHAFVLPATLE